MGLDVTIRPAREDEHALIYSAWINTQHQSRVRKLMNPRAHDAGLHRMIERLLAGKATSVRVAEYEGIAIGFAVLSWRLQNGVDDTTLHYVFVKEPYRRQGVARMLVDRAGTIGRITHKPEEHRNIPIPSSWVYDPFAAWAPE